MIKLCKRTEYNNFFKNFTELKPTVLYLYEKYLRLIYFLSK